MSSDSDFAFMAFLLVSLVILAIVKTAFCSKSLPSSGEKINEI